MADKLSGSVSAIQVYKAARDGSSELKDLLKRLNTKERKTVLETKFQDGGNETTPLIIAARNGHLDSVKILLGYKVDIEARGILKVKGVAHAGCTPLWAATAACHEVLIKRTTDVDGRDAAHEGYIDMVKFLVTNGADINARNDQEATPLMMACCHGQMNVVTYLIDSGAILDLHDADGWTALHFAVYWENFTCVRDLLASGASQLRNNEGLTPLLLASNECKIEMVEYFTTRPECKTEQKIDAFELLGATLADVNDLDSCNIERAFTYMKRGMAERYKDPAHPSCKKEMEPVEAFQNRTESQSLAELALLEGDDHAIHLEGLRIRERILKTDERKLWCGMPRLLSDEATETKLLNVKNQTQVDRCGTEKAQRSLPKGRQLDVNTKDDERMGFGRGRGFVPGVDVTPKKDFNVNYQKKTFARKAAGMQEQFREKRNLTAAIVQERERGECVPDVEIQLRTAVQESKERKKEEQSLHRDTAFHLAVKLQENEPEKTTVEEEVIKRNRQPWKTSQRLTNFQGKLQDEAQQLNEMTRESTNVQGQRLEKGNGQLKQKTQLLPNVEEQLQERDGELREKIQQLTNVQGQLQEKDELLREKIQRLTNVEGQLSERDGQLREKTRQLNNVQEQLQERDGQLEEKTQRLTDVEGQLQERDGQLRERTQQLTDVQGQLQDREKQLRMKTQKLTSVEWQLRQRDGQLREKTRQLTFVEGQLRERDVQLRERTQQLTDVREQLQERDGQMREKSQQLKNVRWDLRQRDGQLTEKTQQLRDVEEQLRERDGQLSEKTQQLTDYEEELQDREGQLLDRTQQLMNVQGEMQQKDERIANLQDQVTALLDQMTEKELELNELETTLAEAQQALNERSRQQSPDWAITRNQIQLTDHVLGRGGWGIVFEGRYCGCAVAVKQIYDLIISDHNRRLFEREMSMAARCRHPCLLQFIGATCDEGSPLLVTELLESSLRALLEQQPLSSIEVFVISLNVARALNYLHLKKPSPIIHRNVSSANVLLWRQADQWRGKVSDYGTANVLQHTMTVCPGSRIYSAPEAFTGNQTEKVDVYSFGVLLCEICIRELPDPERRKEQVAMVTNRVIRALIRGCLQPNPAARPCMEDIIRELEKGLEKLKERTSCHGCKPRDSSSH